MVRCGAQQHPTTHSDAALPSGLPSTAEAVGWLSSQKAGAVNYHNPLLEGLFSESFEQSTVKQAIDA